MSALRPAGRNSACPPETKRYRTAPATPTADDAVEEINKLKGEPSTWTYVEAIVKTDKQTRRKQ